MKSIQEIYNMGHEATEYVLGDISKIPLNEKELNSEINKIGEMIYSDSNILKDFVEYICERKKELEDNVHTYIVSIVQKRLNY